MLDERLTKDIQQWLNSPQEQRSLEKGAEMLLRLNRNRYMNAQILRRANFAKLEYELRKHLRIRLEGLTAREVALMEQNHLPRISTMLDAQPIINADADYNAGNFSGRREDHDELPKDIQDLYERNGEIYFKMKQIYETLKGMEDATPCDRHEYLLQLIELDKEYRENWNAYDTWSAVAAGSAECSAQAPTPNQLQAARKYISENKPKLAKAEGDAADKLRSKCSRGCRCLFLQGKASTLTISQNSKVSAWYLNFEA